MPLMREWATGRGGLARSNREFERLLHAAAHGLRRVDVDAILQDLDIVRAVLMLWADRLSSERASRSHEDTPDIESRSVTERRWGDAPERQASAQERPGSGEQSRSRALQEWADLAVSFEHSEAVSQALRVVAESLSLRHSSTSRGDDTHLEIVGGVDSKRVDAAEAARRISARTRPGDGEELLSSDELAARIGLRTRQSVHDWMRKGRIVGWRGAKRGYLFPAQQVDERGRPPDGLEWIVPSFGDGYAAWVWLTTPLPSLDGAKPLELLHNGEVDIVAAAAKGDLQGDFA